MTEYTIGRAVASGLERAAELWDGVVFWRIEQDGRLLALVDDENGGRAKAEEIVAAFVNAAPDAGDVEALRRWDGKRVIEPPVRLLSDTLNKAIDDASGRYLWNAQIVLTINNAAAREAQLCVSIGRAFDALQDVGYPDDVSDIVDDMKTVAHDSRSDAARKLEDLLYAAATVCAVADEGTWLDLAIEALGEAVEDFMGKKDAALAKASREAQLRQAIDDIAVLAKEAEEAAPEEELRDVLGEIRNDAGNALATPAPLAAERYGALERLPKLLHRALPWVQAAKLIKFRIPYPPTEQPHPDAEALAVEIVAALHELDGKDGVDE